MTNTQKRTIRSFVLRAGRTSKRQSQALSQWLSDYELPVDEAPWDLAQIFNRDNDTIVEIGFGMGASLIEMAQKNPETNYIGIEVHRAGVGSIVADIHELQLKNVRVVMHDAFEVFTKCIPDATLAGIQIFFPDPWPKKKHYKRRLVQPDFIKLLTKKLKPCGFLHCATDWEAYALHMLEVLNSESSLKNSITSGGYSPKPETRPLTKFENRGIKLGHKVWDLLYFAL